MYWTSFLGWTVRGKYWGTCCTCATFVYLCMANQNNTSTASAMQRGERTLRRHPVKQATVSGSVTHWEFFVKWIAEGRVMTRSDRGGCSAPCLVGLLDRSRGNCHLVSLRGIMSGIRSADKTSRTGLITVKPPARSCRVFNQLMYCLT